MTYACTLSATRSTRSTSHEVSLSANYRQFSRYNNSGILFLALVKPSTSYTAPLALTWLKDSVLVLCKPSWSIMRSKHGLQTSHSSTLRSVSVSNFLVLFTASACSAPTQKKNCTPESTQYDPKSTYGNYTNTSLQCPSGMFVWFLICFAHCYSQLTFELFRCTEYSHSTEHNRFTKNNDPNCTHSLITTRDQRCNNSGRSTSTFPMPPTIPSYNGLNCIHRSTLTRRLPKSNC